MTPKLTLTHCQQKFNTINVLNWKKCEGCSVERHQIDKDTLDKLLQSVNKKENFLFLL